MVNNNNNSTSSNNSSDLLSCLFCAEDMSLSGSGPHRALGLHCCGKMVCQSCLYRHIQSVWDEGLTGQGRSLLLCPMGCSHELTDQTIRAAVRRQYPLGIIWSIVGQVVLWILVTWHSSLLPSSSWSRSTSRSSGKHYSWWWYWTHSPMAQRQLQKYERWSLAVALRRMDGVQCCPFPDCGYAWLTNPQYRGHKQQHERATRYLWYSPPSPESIPYDWVEAEYLDMDRPAGFLITERRGEERDGRRMACPKCQVWFCGLCRHPWHVSPTKSHAGLSCAGYVRKYGARYHLNSPDSYLWVGQVAQCRTCPGCSLRTFRTEGCNHMTCPCGTEWCYVCENRWNALHYQCTDNGRAALSDRSAMGDVGCCIM
jgi:hypothetical protein